MQTSRFQLGLIATLAVGLGFSLASSDAVGYPAGAAVSMGVNPLWSHGGTSSSGAVVLFSAPADRDMVLTDLSLSAEYPYSSKVGIVVGGAIAGHWIVSGKSSQAYQVSSHTMAMTSGIRVPAGQSLQLTTEGVDISYAMSGYYAQP